LDLSAILQLFLSIPIAAAAVSLIPVLVVAIASASTLITFDVRAFGVDDCFTRQAGDYFTNELCHFDFYFLTLATLFCSFLQREGRISALQKIWKKWCFN
jgi:hypothetical protein